MLNLHLQLVIGNMLQLRKQQVTIVSQNDQQPISISKEDIAAGIEIEQLIVADVVKRHEAFIKSV